MKTLKHFIETSIFVILTIFAHPVMAQELPVNGQFSSDTTFSPFNGEHDVYSFKMNGYIELLSDSSLIRVILIDHNGNDWLVYEAYPLIDTLDSFSVQDACDETCYLNKITPDSIRVDIINAIVSIEKFTYELNEIQNVNDLQAQVKLLNDSIKVISMNHQNQNNRLFWHADRTSIVGLSFQEKEQKFGRKYNLYGFEYYAGGIFKFYHHRNSYSPNTLTYVSEFDWRNRHSADNPTSPYYNQHGTGWITYPESQNQNGVNTGLCWDFTASHSVADFVNIYCNRFKNYDFSEGKLLCITNAYNGWGCNGGSSEDALQAIFNNGGINREQDANGGCFNYDCTLTNCNSSCSTEKINFSNHQILNFSSQQDIQDAIINKGPMTSGLTFPNYMHKMELIGYKTINDKDTVFSQGNPMPINWYIYLGPPTSINVWIFKNSDWPETGGLTTPRYVLYDDGGSFSNFSTPNYLSGPVSSDDQNTDLTQDWEDKDKDGYYWWGIGLKPTNCPGAQNDEDCDDSNKDLGPYNKIAYSNTYKLYECTSNCDPSLQIPDYPITVNYVWSTSTTSRHIENHIILDPPQGYTITVTIDTKLWFHKNAWITVKPGAVLLITADGYLTSACNSLWKGIEVVGTNDEQELSKQGTVINLGTIESAQCAIQNVLPMNNKNGGGGIIITWDGNPNNAGGKFSGNKTSIYFSNYPKKINLTSFLHAQFIANNILTDGSHADQFIRLESLTNTAANGVLLIKDCSFTENGQVRNIIGINSTNAAFNVSSGNLFTNLLYGIHTKYYDDPLIIGTPPNVPFTVNGSTFANNYRGIYVSGVIAPEIVSSFIDVPLVLAGGIPWIGADNYTSYGIYLEASCHYHIEANTISGPYPYTPGPGWYGNVCGIYVKNSGPYKDNRIYNNYISKLNVGIACFGDNRDGTSGSNVGLELKCNDFTSGGSNINATDIGVYSGYTTPDFPADYGIKPQQGVYNTSSSRLSAGNVFSASVSGHEFDLFNNSNLFQYNYHNPSGQYTPKVEPDFDLYSRDYIQIWKNTQSYYYSSGPSLSCPPMLEALSNSNPQSLKAFLGFAKDKIDSLTSVLSILTDGGNSDSLTLAILSSIPPEAWDLYLDLMSKSPFLSDSALKSAAIKENVLINAMIRDIMVANPQSAKSDSIIQLLENRFIPLPDSMMAEILEGRDTLGAKEILINSRTDWYQAYGDTFSLLMKIYQEDTLIVGTSDSIIALLQYDFRLESKYDLAFRLLDKYDYYQADQVIEDIPNNYYLNSKQSQEYQKYLCLYKCVKRAILDSSSICFDSIQIHILDSLVSTDTNYLFIPTVYVRNALQTAGLKTYHECLLFDPELKSSKIHPGFNRHKSSISYLKVYPNPAIDYIILDYKIDPRFSHGYINITGMDGIVKYNQKLDHIMDQKIIRTETFDNGIYLITLNVDGKNVQTIKLIILK